MTDTQALKEAAIRAVDARSDLLAEIALRIHANPELGFKEYKAAQWLIEPLAEAGFEIEKGTGGLETAFRAIHRGPRPGSIIALLGEYDALPNIGHACGHNLIGSAAVGAGLAVKEACTDLPGQVEVIGCPAEEVYGGKIIMTDNGAFDHLSAALEVHPQKRNMVTRNGLARTRLILKFHGRAAHAASSHTAGISALDALIHTFVAVNSLRQFMPDGMRVHGIITKGGDSPNVVPHYTEGVILVRGQTMPLVMAMREKVLKCAEAQAEAVGCRFEFEEGLRYAERIQNLVIADLARKNMEQLGLEVVDPIPGGTGSSDVGNVGLKCPICHPFIAIAPENVNTHNPEFAEAAASEAGIRGMLLAAKTMAMTLIDLAYDPDKMAAARAEWEAWKARREA